MTYEPRENVIASRTTPPHEQPSADAITTTLEANEADPTRARLCRIDHVGIAVADLDTTIDFYQTVFGMHCEHVEENSREGVREAMLSVGPDPAASRVQLLAPLSSNSTIARFLDQSGPGLQQVAYTVADLDEVSAALRNRGIRLLYRNPQRGTAGSRVNFVHPNDTGGVLIELVEPAACS